MVTETGLASTDTVLLASADSKLVKPVSPMLRVYEQTNQTVSLAIGGMHPRDFAKAPEHIRHEVHAIEIERMIVRLSMSGCMDANVVEARRRMDAFAQVSEDGDVRPEYIQYLLERRRMIERLFQGHPRKLMIGNNPGKLDRHAPLHPDLSEAQSIAFQTIGSLLPSEPMPLNIRLSIALQEAMANHIRHGNCCDPTKIFTAEVGRTRNGLSIIFQDEGWGFDPSRVNDPTAPEHLETVSGRGMTLMTEFMDSIQYTDHGRRCVMTKNF